LAKGEIKTERNKLRSKHNKSKNSRKRRKNLVKVNKAKLIQGRQSITYFGSHCEYIDLCKLRENSGCVDGTKFILKQSKTEGEAASERVRRQFLLMDQRTILTFLKAGVKFPQCGALTKDVTSSIKCKAVEGGSEVDLDTAATDSTTTTAEATTAAATTTGATTTAATTTAVTQAATSAGSSNSIVNTRRNFTHYAHKAYGYITFTSDTEISLTSLYYDGAGPKTNFIVGTSDSVGVHEGTLIIDQLKENGEVAYEATDDNAPSQPAFDNTNLALKLPVVNGMQLTFQDIKWVSLYCRQVKMNFMDIMVPGGFQ